MKQSDAESGGSAIALPNAGDGRPVDAVIQIHPTTTCNLACLHCYSSSGPDKRGALDAGMLERVLREALSLGYTRVSFSGGEPLMYRDLLRLLSYAKQLGMSTSVTTNGMLVTPESAAWLADLADAVAVSIDGVPASHNRIRGATRAFAHMERGLGHFRAAGVTFATIFTLTENNLEELSWVAALTARYGGAGVQIHPLESVGRAVTHMSREEPQEHELAQAWGASLRLASGLVGQSSGLLAMEKGSVPDKRIGFHADIADVRQLLRHPELVLPREPMVRSDFSQAVRPLVIEEDGTVVPTSYGFARRYALGNVLGTSLIALAERWLLTCLADYERTVRSSLAELDGSADWPFVNWYAHLAANAAKSSMPLAPR